VHFLLSCCVFGTHYLTLSVSVILLTHLNNIQKCIYLTCPSLAPSSASVYSDFMVLYKSCIIIIIIINHYIADVVVDYIERVTEMMTEEPVAVLQDCDCSDGTATKQFCIT